MLLSKPLNSVILPLFLNLCTGLKLMNTNYKLLSLTYKLLTCTKTSYLYKLISVQPPRNTRSSSSVTISWPSSSSLKITNRSFHSASPHLWNQASCLVSLMSVHVRHHFYPSQVLFFHSRLSTYLFSQVFPHHRFLVLYSWTAFSDLDCFLDSLCSLVCFIFLSLFLFSFWSRVAD